jgi:hypothetical protein
MEKKKLEPQKRRFQIRDLDQLGPTLSEAQLRGVSGGFETSGPQTGHDPYKGDRAAD